MGNYNLIGVVFKTDWYADTVAPLAVEHEARLHAAEEYEDQHLFACDFLGALARGGRRPGDAVAWASEGKSADPDNFIKLLAPFWAALLRAPGEPRTILVLARWEASEVPSAWEIYVEGADQYADVAADFQAARPPATPLEVGPGETPLVVRWHRQLPIVLL